MKVKDIAYYVLLASLAGMYFLFIKRLENSQKEFQKHLLNRFSDFAATHEPMPETGLFTLVTEEPEDEVHIEGLGDE